MRIIAFIWLLILGGHSSAETPLSSGVDIDVVTQSDDLGRRAAYIEDSAGKLELEDVLEFSDNEWSGSTGKLVNFGYSTSAYWFKLELVNKQNTAQERILEVGYSVLDYLDVYVMNEGVKVDEFFLGDKLHFSERPISNRNFLIPLELGEGERLTVILRVKTNSAVQLPLSLWSVERFYEADQLKLIFHGVYFGIALVMMIYNLFVFIAVSEKTYLYYVIYIAFMALFLASLNSFTFQYLWPDATWWNDQSIVLFLNGGVIFGALFSLSFLSIHPSSHRLLSYFMSFNIAGGGMLMVLSLILPYNMVIRPTIFLAMAVCIALILLGAYRWYRGDLSARYFTVAWFSLLLGGVILALNKFSVLPQNLFTENATQIGSAIEIILLSLALADRLYQEKRLSIAAQHRALMQERAARVAQESALDVQREANVMLERRVSERTIELEKLNKRLRELSSTDALTGVKNRGSFEDTFEKLFVSAARHERPISLLIIDIDHFKAVNDEYGHQAGDACLKTVADILIQVVSRSQDLVARYGGEEFVILLPDTVEQGALKVAEKVRSLIETCDVSFNGMSLSLTASVGVASMAPRPSDSRSHMFGLADKALYKAKEGGRNKVESAF